MEILDLRMALLAAWRAGRLTDDTWLAVERELQASGEGDAGCGT